MFRILLILVLICYTIYKFGSFAMRLFGVETKSKQNFNTRTNHTSRTSSDNKPRSRGQGYQGGEYVGADDEGNFYKGIVTFMIIGLKECIPYDIQAMKNR